MKKADFGNLRQEEKRALRRKLRLAKKQLASKETLQRWVEDGNIRLVRSNSGKIAYLVCPTTSSSEEQSDSEPVAGSQSDSLSNDTDSVESSDDEYSVTWRSAKMYKLVFGKYKGKRLGTMILAAKNREYLRYILSWDKLHRETAVNITCALEHYRDRQKSQSKPKRGMISQIVMSQQSVIDQQKLQDEQTMSQREQAAIILSNQELISQLKKTNDKKDERLVALQNQVQQLLGNNEVTAPVCSRSWCKRMVTQRFASRKWKKMCQRCTISNRH
jgi:hypothetical protein